MLYLFSGDDAKRKIIGYENFLKTIPESAEVLSVSRNSFEKAQIESLYSGSSLFSALYAIVFSGVLEHEETRDFVLQKLGQMGESDNLFIFLEGKLTKPILDSFKKSRAEINVFELSKEKKEKFDNFLLAGAFANRDKLNTWVYFREAVDKGVALEELTGVLFWKIKDMILKKNFSKFKEHELKNFAAKISYILPEARKAGRDAESAFEQFLLEVFS